MDRKKLATLLFSIFFGLSLIAQEKVYVPFFSCEDCSKQTGISSAMLFADFVNEVGRFKAEIAQKRDTSAEAETFNMAKESSELISSKYFVLGKVIRLESSLYVKISLYASSSGNLFWSSNAVASSPSDLPNVLKNLAVRLADVSKNSKPGDIFISSKGEGKKLNRRKSNKSVGFSTGFMIPLSQDATDQINPGFGGLIAFDNRDFIFNVTGEIYLGKDSVYDSYDYADVKNTYYNLGLDVLYPFGTRNNAAFASLGSGFSYRQSELKLIPTAQGDSEREFVYEGGLLVNGGFGYILKRNSDAALFISAKGYAFIPNMDHMIYGLMLNFAVHIEGW